MGRIYISDIVPQDKVKEYNASQASLNFNTHINQLGCFDRHIAIPPINVGREFKSQIDSKSKIEYHTIRIFPHKNIFRYLNSIIENIWLYFQIRKSDANNIWLYNISKLNLLAFWLLSLFSNKNIFVLLADYNPERNRGIIGKLILAGLKRVNGIISLTNRCGDLNKNFLCIPGIIPIHDIKRDPKFQHNNTFLISGALSPNTGIDIALETFAKVPAARLIITGKGDKVVDEMCKKYASKYQNIEYLGFLEKYSDFKAVLDESDFILSFRNPCKEVNQFNFPSKILESLALNKVVISTQEYSELDGVDYIYVPFDKNNIIELLQKIVSGSMDQKINNCTNNHNALINKFTERVWLNAFTRIENAKYS